MSQSAYTPQKDQLTPTGVVAGSYTLPTLVIDELGRITGITNGVIQGLVPFGGTANQVLAKLSSSDFDVQWVDAAVGGTSLPTQTGNLGKFLTTDGTSASWGVIPILNQDTTGTATNVTGVVAPANGGTGLTSYTTGSFFAATSSSTMGQVSATGSGSVVRGTSPTLVTPILGTPTSVTLTNATGLVATTGLTATGTKNSTTFLRGDDTWAVPAGGGSGTVTSVTSANGAATIATGTTTPVITIVSAPILTTARTIAGVSFNGSANIAIASTGLSDTALLARLASPALSGTPTAPTATVGTNTTQIATTAFVLANAGSSSASKPFIVLKASHLDTTALSSDTTMRNNHHVTNISTLYFTTILPNSYAGGGITIDIISATATDTDNAHNLNWEASMDRVQVGTFDLDVASFSTPVSSTSQAIPTNSGITMKHSIALTSGAQMDSTVAGESFQLKLSQLGNVAGVAQIIAIQIRET